MVRTQVIFTVAATVAALLLAACGTVATTPSAGTGGATVGTSAAATVSGALPTPSPAASPGVVTPGAEGLTVSTADDGGTVALVVGQRFLLALGNDLDWTVTVGDPAVVSRVVNIMVVRGAQGVYVANAPGETTLSATGDAPCRKATPPCAVSSRAFRIRIIVRPASATPTP